MIRCLFSHFVPFIKEPLLEIGAADGYMTSLIQTKFTDIDHEILEPSHSYAKLLRKRFPQIKTHIKTIELFSTQKRYQTIIASHVLEHVEFPNTFLTSIHRILKPRGNFLISVPNALSIHRLSGVALGLIKKPNSLNEQDKRIGHYRVYTPDLLQQEIESCGFSIVIQGTSFFKPVHNSELESDTWKHTWPKLRRMNTYTPENGADIYLTCRKKTL